jgi:DNA-binding XRE family transcriptional regulator
VKHPARAAGYYAESLKQARRAFGLTQRQLAEQLGVAANTVARWERGELDPSRLAFLAIKSVREEMYMTRYSELFEALGNQFQQREQFEARGARAMQALLTGFAAYLQAPQGSCRVGPPDAPLDCAPARRVEDAIALQDDWFSASLVVSEPGPIGGVIRFGFQLRIEDDSTVVVVRGASDDKEFRLESMDESASRPFFEHVVTHTLRFLRTRPEKLLSGKVKAPIGFV